MAQSAVEPRISAPQPATKGAPISRPERVGRYVLFEEIAQGGMASIHLARAGAGDSRQLFAIKRLHRHLARDPAFVTLLLDEARATERIRHPNVVSVLDVVASDGELMIVMDYAVGDTLAGMMGGAPGERAALPGSVAAAILVDVLEGLHAAHEVTGPEGEPLGLIHRDVTPNNVFIREDGTAQVLDFGIAKARGSLNTTREGQLKGTLPFLAPEQVRGREPTRRVDVYAAGCVLWEMLVGRRLFAGANEGEIIERILFDEVEPPSRQGAEVSPALDAVVMRAISRSPDARFATAVDLAAALREAVSPAPRSEVAALLAARCGPALEQRRTRARELERIDLGARASQEQPRSAASPSGDASPRRWTPLILAGIAVLGGSSAYALMSRTPAALVLAGPDLALHVPSTPARADVASAPQPPPSAAPAPGASTAPEEAPPRGPPQAPRRAPPGNTQTSCVKVAPDGTKQFDRECLKRKAQ